MRKSILTLAALLGGACISSATVTVQGWWHLDSTQPTADSSGNARNFGSAYSTDPAVGGVVAALLVNNGAGGPLDNSGWISSECVRVGIGANGGSAQDSMWGIGYNPPAQNFGIEAWLFPQSNGHPYGTAGGVGGWILSSGQSGGVGLRIYGPGTGVDTTQTNSYFEAFDLGNGNQIGNVATVDTNKWMHLAIVNAAGTTTFYTNGIPCGPSLTTATTTSAGDAYAFSAPGDNAAYCGYADEMRMFTFAAGAFTTNDLLLRPAGPNLISEPQSASVWTGGAAPFAAIASFEGNLVYQWHRGTTNIPGATASYYLLPAVATTDSGSTFACVVKGQSGLSVTSAPAATLTVVTPNTANVGAYRAALSNAPAFLAFFPVDNCTNVTVTNLLDATHNGALENNATYDGRTSDSFGQRALSFNFDGDVEVPNNPAYEFAGGFGTIEALVYLSQAPVQAAAIFSENSDGGAPYYSLLADTTGQFLIYSNDQAVLSWTVPGGLVGKVLDVALVFDNVTNVTAYVNGQSLGTQQQPSFGTQPGGSFWMGGIGNYTTGNRWGGTIDELAIYGTNLSAATIAGQYTKYVYGTNTAPPTITSQPNSKTLLAGGSPQLTVTVTGALPFSYQWTSNSVNIPGATSATLILSNATVAASATYALTINNVFGSTNTQPIVLTFLTPPAGYLAGIMADNPTALWRLAETSGTNAADSAGLNDAVYSAAGVTHGIAGPPGDIAGGTLFNGSSGRAVTPAHYADLNPSGPFSVEFWAKISATTATAGHFYSPISSMPRSARTGGYEWYMGGNSSGYEFHTAEAGNYSLITADNNAPPVGSWWYLTGIWDGTNMYLYVNGQLGNDQIDPPAPAGTDDFTDEGQGQTVFLPNTSVPFYIGSRSDNADYFDGAMADVAFYNYALSYQQVTNHWSYAWTPATVTAPPGVTNTEGSTITLTPTVTGLPNTYQWLFNGNPLSDTLNSPDNTAHYPNDVTNVSLVISEATPADSGLYSLQVINPVGGTVSGNIKVVITANTNPPMVSAVIPLGTPNVALDVTNSFVKVLYTRRVDPNTAVNPANYSFSPPLSIVNVTLLGSGTHDLAAAALGADFREVILETSGLTPVQKYSLTVSGVLDQSQTPLTIPTSTNYFHGPVLAAGVANWDYYYLGVSSSGVSSLLGNPNYPNAPMTNAYLTSLDTSGITKGDLNNNAIFGSLGDYYGDVTSGWLTPTVSGLYTFFLWADDGGEFDLSTDANPANVSGIAYETSAGSGFVETNTVTPPNRDSSPIALTAGHAYYFQLLHAEITGGDYARVAWRISTDSTAATNLVAIPGTYLSAFEQVAPQISSTTLSNGNFTVNWKSDGGTIQASTNLLNWINVPGNPNPLVVPVTSLPAVFYRIVQ